jgi:O-antigen/teichoic acid export membrane protein
MIKVLDNRATLRLTRGGLLARNTVYNFIGQGAPVIVALFAIPVIIKGLGTDRFGVLTLVWMVIGYFSLFDLGLGRALTKIVAEKLGAVEEETISYIIWTCLFLMLILGLIGTVLLCLLSPWLIYHVLEIPKALQYETLHAFYLLAFSVPIVISTAGLRGVLEAQQRFKIINVFRIAMGILTYLAPLLVLLFSKSLFIVVLVLLITRFFTWLGHLLLCLYVTPKLSCSIKIKRTLMAPLLSFGSWITVSNIIDPFMVYLDRFFIGAFISMEAVAYYVTPYELITKLWLVPGSITGVLFPAFSTSFLHNPDDTIKLFNRGIRFLFMILFPIVFFIIVFAQEGLNLWLGKEFAQHCTSVLKWLTLGVFINSLARFPSALIQSVGRPDLTAKLHLIELPLYLLGVWSIIPIYGINGVAVAWVGRIIVDTVLLFGISGWLIPKSKHVILRTGLLFAGSLFVLGVGLLPLVVAAKLVLLIIMLLIFILVAWFLILEQGERIVVQNWFQKRQFYGLN